MLRDLESSKRTTSLARKRNTRGRGVSILLLLAIGLGSAAQLATSVQPAPQGGITNARFYFTVNAPSQLCIGESKVVTVRPLFDMTGTLDDGKPFDLKEHIFTGVSVAAEILDKSIATVSPASAKSGALTRNLFETRSPADFGLSAKFGTLEFSVKGVKAGSTALILTAQAPVPAGSNQTRYFGPSGMPPSIAIKVVNCRYKITLKGTSAGSGDNIFLTQVYKATGEIGGDPSAALTGDAQVSWHMTQAGDCYTASTTSPPSTAHLKGTLSEDGGTLTVNVTFDALTVSTTVRAAGICARSGASATSQGQLQPAPIVFMLKGSGETASQPITLPDGVVTLTGTATLTAVPIASQ